MKKIHYKDIALKPNDLFKPFYQENLKVSCAHTDPGDGYRMWATTRITSDNVTLNESTGGGTFWYNRY